MDTRRFLIASMAFLFIGGAAVRADDQNLLKAQQWLADDKSAQLEILSSPYASAPDFEDPGDKVQYEIGEALFRSPILLGGQAAKAQLSCNSCHLSGSGNDQFLFSHISGAPGTADVSSSFFSSFRGNQEFDPVKIPDLRKVGKISIHNGDDLRMFIKGLIVEEFNGKAPPPAALDAITFYVKSVAQYNIGAAANDNRRLSVADPLHIIDTSYDNMQSLLAVNDIQMAILLADASRHQLGLIYERYQNPTLSALQNQIISSSNALARRKNDWASHKNTIPNAAHIEDDIESLKAWRREFIMLKTSLLKAEKKSLYNHARLKKALDAK